MITKPASARLAKRQSNTILSALRYTLAATLLCAQVGWSWAEEYTEQVYDSGEEYEQTYDNGGAYSDESQLDNGDAYETPNEQEIEPTMDPEHADMVRDAKASCTQWANESGLETEDKQAFIDDCVYSQTGY